MAINVFVKSGGTTLETINATVNQVLYGFTYNDSNGEVQTGEMPNRGSLTVNATVDGSYTGSAGYYSSIKITGPTLSGNATTSQVLNGNTFYSNSGTKKTGTMTNHGAINTSISVGGSYTGGAGYYSSINISGPILSGNATTGVVRSGYTFYSSNGTKLTGTLATQTLTSTTVPNGGTINGSVGYYSSFSIKATYSVSRKTFAINTYWANSGVVASGYWGGSSSNTATSYKMVASGGYIWATVNEGSNCNLYITRAYTY